MTKYKINSLKDLENNPDSNWLDVVRQVFPKASDKILDGLLWECTGFPDFYYGDDAIVWFLKQLEEFKKAANDWDGDPATEFDFSLEWDEVKGEWIKIPKTKYNNFKG